MNENSESTVSIKRRKHTAELKSKALEMIQGGASLREISQLIGVAKSTIYGWTLSNSIKKERNQKKYLLKKEKMKKTPIGKTLPVKLMGFRELKIIQNKCSPQESKTDSLFENPSGDVHNKSVPQNTMIQICSPDGFTMLIPSGEEKLISLFFNSRSKCL